MATQFVFISHSSDDDQRARELASDLQAKGIRVWIDHEQIRFGDSIPQKISEGLSQATVLLVLVSESFVKSNWCRAEYEALIMNELSSGNIVVVPVRLDDAEIPILLRAKRFVDLRNDKHGWEWERLVRHIGEASYITTVNRIPRSPSYHCSLLSMIIGGVVRDFPVTTMTDERIVTGKALIDLYRTVDTLVDQFEKIVRCLSRDASVGFDFGEDWAGQLGDIEREMRTLASAFDGILGADSELRNRLNNIFQLCVHIGSSEADALIRLGPQESYAIRDQVDSSGDHIGEYQQVLSELSRYRHELRDAVARAVAASP